MPSSPGGGEPTLCYRLARGLSVPDIEDAFKDKRLAKAVQDGGAVVGGLRSLREAGSKYKRIRDRLSGC